MSGRRALGLLAATFALVVLVTAGVYVVVDIARWEWNRAMISGIFFLAALVVVSTGLVLRAIGRLGGRVDALERRQREPLAAPTPDLGAGEALRDAGRAEADRRFEWLRQPPDRLGVFVPVLLGAGVLMSVVAYAVERVAGWVAGATIDERTARWIARDLPISGLAVVEPVGAPAHSRHRRVVAVVAVLVLAVVGIVGVELIRQLTQSRPGTYSGPGTTELVIEVRQRGAGHAPEDVAEALWVVCRDRVPGDASLTEPWTRPDGTVALVIDRALGTTGRRRIVGCIEDHTIDRVLAEVVDVRSTPA